MALTNAQMQAVQQAGGSVVYRGQVIKKGSALPSDVTIAADIAADLIKDAQMDVGKSTAFPKTSTGATTLVAAAALDRAVLIHVRITTTFAAGDGAAPIFDIGETDTAEKFQADLNSGSSGTVTIYGGTLSANKALIVSSTAATGTTSAGAITVTALTLPTL